MKPSTPKPRTGAPRENETADPVGNGLADAEFARSQPGPVPAQGPRRKAAAPRTDPPRRPGGR